MSEIGLPPFVLADNVLAVHGVSEDAEVLARLAMVDLITMRGLIVVLIRADFRLAQQLPYPRLDAPLSAEHSTL